jgi:hypothetical protein
VFHRQICHCLNHFPSPLYFSWFSGSIMHFIPRPALDHDPPTYTSGVAGTTDMKHHVQLLLWDRDELTFLPGLAWNCNSPIPASQVGEIIGINHHALLRR